jgi:hypothetical protein
LWNKELADAKMNCENMEICAMSMHNSQQAIALTGEQIANSRDQVKAARDKLWGVLWIMRIAGISDSSEELTRLSTKMSKAIKSEPAVVRDGLVGLEAALAAVEFIPLEQRLRVVTAPYPLESNYRMDVLEGKKLFQQSVDDWRLDNGDPLFDPEIATSTPRDASQFITMVKASSARLDTQKTSGHLVTSKPPASISQTSLNVAHFKGFPVFQNHGTARSPIFKATGETNERLSCLKSVEVSSCGKCRNLVRKDAAGVVSIQVKVKNHEGNDVDSYVRFHAECCPDNGSDFTQGASSSETQPVQAAQPLPVSLRFACAGCGLSVNETGDKVVKIRGKDLKLRGCDPCYDDANPRLRSTFYYHYDCSPDKIGYCSICHKPILNESDVLRPDGIPSKYEALFLYHRRCLPDSPLLEASRAT